MEVLLQLLIGGILQGGIYALGAFGLSPFAAVVLVFPAFVLIGIVVERVMIRPMRAQTAHEFLVASILITLGIALAVEDLLAFSMVQPVKGIDYSLAPFRVGGLVISTLRLLSLGLILLLSVALHFFLQSTLQGKAIRAVIEDREGAMLAGINVLAVSRNTFGLGIALTSVAGVFFISIIPVEPPMGLPLTLKYLSIIVLGGIGNLPGTLLGVVILGRSDSLVGFWWAAEWSLTVAFVILIAILLWRPKGLFG